jgi:hypothetical protein
MINDQMAVPLACHSPGDERTTPVTWFIPTGRSGRMAASYQPPYKQVF